MMEPAHGSIGRDTPTTNTTRMNEAARILGWRHSHHVQLLGKAVATGIAYYLLAQLGVATGISLDGIATLWPPNAIIFCTLLIVPISHWWIYICGFVCAEILGDIPKFTIFEAIGLGIVNCFEGALSAFIIRQVVSERFDLSSSRQLQYFALVCVIGVPSVAALGGASIFVTAGSEESYLVLWRTWWLGDAIGILTVGPFILVMWRTAQDGFGSLRTGYWVELILALVLLGAVATVSFKLDLVIAEDYYRLFYIYPILVWISLRCGILGATASGMLTALVVSWMAVSGDIPVGETDKLDNVLFFQCFLAVTILTPLTLAVLVHQMAALNQKLGVKSERIRSEKEILEAKEQAERANAAKTMFLGHMSHELRTPLNSIIGYSSSLRSNIFGPVPNERYGEYLAIIEQSGLHLLSVINDLIDISRIEGETFELSEDIVAPASIVDEVLRILNGSALAKHIILRKSTPPNLPNLRCDEIRVRQILINVVSNAVKFSHENGRVDVSTAFEDGTLKVRVRDRGEGVAADQINDVFEPYQQFSTDPHVRAEGSGLGLYVSRRLMDAHGSRITFDSAIGIGTTVTLVFQSERVVLQRI